MCRSGTDLRLISLSVAMSRADYPTTQQMFVSCSDFVTNAKEAPRGKVCGEREKGAILLHGDDAARRELGLDCLEARTVPERLDTDAHRNMRAVRHQTTA